MLIPQFMVRKVSIVLMILAAGMVFGQDYPNKPVHIFTTTAGGGSDFAARLIAQGISGPLGQPVIVENRGNILAAEAVSKAAPDGYSVLVTGGSFWVGPLLQKVPYDVVRDFSPVSMLVREVNVIAVHPSVPAKSVKELIVLAKAKPGELNYSTSSSGSPGHLGMELFKSMAGVNIVRINYKGTAAAITALLSGETQLTIADVGLMMPHGKSGRLRILAVTAAEPSALAPGLPTVAALGLPGYETVGSTSVFAPGKTPGAIINRLNQEIVRYLNRADVKERVLSAGAEVVASSPEQFSATIKAEMAKWGKVINDAGIKLD